MKNMTCLQVHNDYLIAGGETKSAKLIADAMERTGITVIRYYRSNEEIKSGFFNKLSSGVQSLYSSKTFTDLEKIIKNRKIDFALIHNTSPLISNSVYAVLKKYNIPIIKYMQNYNLLCLNGEINQGDVCKVCKNDLYTGVKNKCYKDSCMYSFIRMLMKKDLDRRYLNDISAFIAISNFVKKKHIEYGIPERKIHTVYHFIDDTSRLKDEYEYCRKDEYVVYMGRLSREKGLYTLLNTFKKAPAYKLKIMGGDGIESELREYVDQNSINNVEFMGFCDGKVKMNLLKNAKAMIVPSEWDEPFGRIVIESYQYATPVIATNRGGLPELIEEGKTGYVYECGNTDDLENKLRAIYGLSNSEYKEMRNECLLLVERKFVEKAYIEDLLTVINAVVK